jgi:hypothetical protein
MSDNLDGSYKTKNTKPDHCDTSDTIIEGNMDNRGNSRSKRSLQKMMQVVNHAWIGAILLSIKEMPFST